MIALKGLLVTLAIYFLVKSAILFMEGAFDLEIGNSTDKDNAW